MKRLVLFAFNIQTYSNIQIKFSCQKQFVKQKFTTECLIKNIIKFFNNLRCFNLFVLLIIILELY